MPDHTPNDPNSIRSEFVRDAPSHLRPERAARDGAVDSVPSVEELRPQNPDALSHNEVAAVSVDRAFYVSDMPSPYLSTRQAQEDVQTTKRRHTTIAVVCVLVFLLGLAGAGGWWLWKTLRPNVGIIPKFDTATIELGEFVESIEVTSLVQPIDERAVAPDVSGTIREALVQVGSLVEEGSPLFALDNAAITESVNSAKQALDTVLADADAKLASLNEAINTVNDAQRSLDEATNDAERIAAEAALKAAQSHLQTMQVESDAAEATLQTIQQTYDQALAQQSALTVRAPIAGTITELSPNAAVSSTVLGTTALCVVSNTSSFRIQIEVPADRRGRIGEGQPVRLTFPTIPDLVVMSSIASIDDTEGLSIATVIVNEPDERIQKGIAVETSTIVQSVPNSLMVPNEALRVAEDGTPRLDVLLDPSRGIHSEIPVTIVAQDATHAAIAASNIQEGNAVILQQTDGE